MAAKRPDSLRALVKQAVHDIAIVLERLIEPLIPASRKPPVIEPYLGYGTGALVVLRGRVLAGLRRVNPDPTQGRWTNFKQMLSLFLTSEVADVDVTAIGHDRTVHTDEEGYFHIELPRAALKPGWHAIPLEIPGQADSQVIADVMLADPAAEFGIVSDVDDTMMETGAYSLARNLWTSLTGSALTRHVFPDAVALMERLHDGRNPVYYVSSSPWNLHAFLDSVLFRRAGLVRGPLFLRDLGISEKQFISGTHGDHKGRQIDILFEAHPRLTFVLIGDSGQHDAQVYRDAAARWPGRVRQVILRAADPTPDPLVARALQEILDMGVPVWTGTDYGLVQKLETGAASA